MNQLSFQLVERGASLAAEKADRDCDGWTEKALAAFKEYAATHQEFTTEDVIVASAHVPVPEEKRAWGAVVIAAKKAGLITKAGYTTAKNLQSHCRPVSLWRSLVAA